jgi:molecular chaperone Hsp33
MYEQYFAQSVQLPTRFFELQADEMIMVQGLPQVDRSWIDSLSAESSHGLVRDRETLIESRSFAFRCGCTADRLAEALVGVWGEKPQELFQGEDGVEISCPRCGGRWWMDRERFDAERTRHRGSDRAG